MSTVATARISADLVTEIVRRLVTELAPKQIYLFGSQVCGTPDADSDVDVLVLVDDGELARDDHDFLGYRCLRGMFLPIELHIRGEQEFERRARMPLGFEQEILEKGRLLYAA